MAEGMGRNRLLVDLVKQSGVYGRSLTFFLTIGVLVLVGLNVNRLTLQADEPPTGTVVPGALELSLQSNGELYYGSRRLGAQLSEANERFLFRYQIMGTLISEPPTALEDLKIVLHLPQAASEETVSHFFRNSGGAVRAESQLLDPQTILYSAASISPKTRLTVEVEVPQSFIQRSMLFNLRQQLQSLPIAVWVGLSLALPLLTLLLLGLVSVARLRPTRIPAEVLKNPPSKLAPALLGILLNGKLTSRELAATFFDLARRGHLIIRQEGLDDFRFSRHHGTDKLEPFEEQLLIQIFGTDAKSDTKEVSLSLERALFSERISQAFLLAYQRINQLGYFYTNPLRLHRRYQVLALALLSVGLFGFFANLLFFADFRYLLLFWLAMMIAAILVVTFARGLPSRTTYGQNELGRWLAFRRFLISRQRIPYQGYTQAQYLEYLPYAIIFQVEPEWTRRFYDLPFNQPAWYLAARITTIDEFANKIFPMFGYLSHALAVSSAPSVR